MAAIHQEVMAEATHLADMAVEVTHLAGMVATLLDGTVTNLQVNMATGLTEEVIMATHLVGVVGMEEVSIATTEAVTVVASTVMLKRETLGMAITHQITEARGAEEKSSLRFRWLIEFMPNHDSFRSLVYFIVQKFTNVFSECVIFKRKYIN